MPILNIPIAVALEVYERTYSNPYGPDGWVYDLAIKSGIEFDERVVLYDLCRYARAQAKEAIEIISDLRGLTNA